MFRVPRVETVMVIGKRHKDSRASLLVSCDQLVRLPIQQRPLGAKVFVSETRWGTVMLGVILVLPLALNVHIARVPVTRFRNALGTPVNPDPELCIPVPIRRLIVEQ